MMATARQAVAKVGVDPTRFVRVASVAKLLYRGEFARFVTAMHARNVWRVGDCLAPRPLGFTIADGHRLGREIHSATPGIPQPPRVERDADAATASFELVAVALRRSRTR
jgi:hypothetical protein